MSWSHEIIRAIILAFGCTEIITNSLYLLKEGGMKVARKQHGELPPAITEGQLRLKVICMLITGVLFFVCGLRSFVLHIYTSTAFIITAAMLVAYASVEALYYKYWKTTGFWCVSVLILGLLVLIR